MKTIAKTLIWKSIKHVGFRFLAHLGANLVAPGLGSVVVEAGLLAYKVGTIAYKIY